MVIKNKYVIGCLVQFYEIEMLREYVDSCIQMIQSIQNPENITFHFGLGMQTYLEHPEYPDTLTDIDKVFTSEMGRIIFSGSRVKVERYTDKEELYNIAAYRRNLCWEWCNKTDFVLWGETDSLWPRETISIIEQVSDSFAGETPKFILSFAYRVNWDSSWDVTRHPLFELEKFQDNNEWMLNNEASEKSYMTLERMYEINDTVKEYEIIQIDNPKADGSCLVISSELIRSGVNIPHSIILCGEDESFLRMAKTVMGKNFVQYIVKNILRVHNRRHPKKRMYVAGENNPNGFCDNRKGQWWVDLEQKSKFNLETLSQQKKSMRFES